MKIHNLTIRSATLQDAADIAHINLLCWKKNYTDIVNQQVLNNLSFDDKFQSRKKTSFENNEIHLVACLDNNIVGFSDAGKFFFKERHELSESQKFNRNEIGEIYTLYVHPNYQHSGIGSALFKQVSIQLIEKKLSPFLVWTLKENHSARHFYEKNGGKQVDEVVNKKYGHIEIAYQFNFSVNASLL